MDGGEGIGLVFDRDGEDEKFDLVVSCMHLHWVNDVPGVMAACRALMAPDGFFVGAMLGGNTLQEMRIACTWAQQERCGGVAPRTSPAVHVRDAGNLLPRAGFRLLAGGVDEGVMRGRTRGRPPPPRAPARGTFRRVRPLPKSQHDLARRPAVCVGIP